jgi:hypothetical protein
MVDASAADHTCQQETRREVSSECLPCDRVHDARGEMKAECERMAMCEVLKSSIVIANEIVDATVLKYAEVPYEGLRIDQLKGLVQRVRKAEFADWEGIISAPPLRQCSDYDERLFLQFNASVNIDQKLQKIIGFAHPDLMNNLKFGKVHLFADCTFSCVPNGFSQCLVVMAHDKSTSVYVPIFYVLLQSKKEETYKHALRLCAAAANDRLEVHNVTCDFEMGIINAMKDQFKKPVVGCEFHWKQAVRRKLLALQVPKENISDLMGPDGLIHLLTEIPIADIERKGIPYIRHRYNEGQHKPKFDAFWKYFVDTWMVKYNPEDWNVNASNSQTNETILNRTNNPLESFNRKLNGYFARRHPTMVQYVSGIRQISLEYSALLLNIRRGRARPPSHEEVTRHNIPPDYEAFASVASVVHSRYAKLNEFRFLENTTHYDSSTCMVYKVIKVECGWRKVGAR